MERAELFVDLVAQADPSSPAI